MTLQGYLVATPTLAPRWVEGKFGGSRGHPTIQQPETDSRYPETEPGGFETELIVRRTHDTQQEMLRSPLVAPDKQEQAN